MNVSECDFFLARCGLVWVGVGRCGWVDGS